MNVPHPPRDAATVALLRDTAGGSDFEVFLVRRHGGSGFMANAHVFPGGKLDHEDGSAAIADRLRGGDAAGAAARLGEPGSPSRALALHVAAIRETFEEAGVLLADVGAPRGLAALPRPLPSNVTFSEWLERLDAWPRLDWVVPLSRWVTPVVEPRRFDARFFVARLPEGQTPRHDSTETTDSAWMRPADAITRQRAGELHLAPPTLRTLENFAEFRTIDAVLTDAASRPPPLVCPVAVEQDGDYVLVLPGDPAHPEPEIALRGPTRFVLAHGRFWSRDPSEPRGG